MNTCALGVIKAKLCYHYRYFTLSDLCVWNFHTCKNTAVILSCLTAPSTDISERARIKSRNCAPIIDERFCILGGRPAESWARNMMKRPPPPPDPGRTTQWKSSHSIHINDQLPLVKAYSIVHGLRHTVRRGAARYRPPVSAPPSSFTASILPLLPVAHRAPLIALALKLQFKLSCPRSFALIKPLELRDPAARRLQLG